MISKTARRMRAGAVAQRNMGWVPLPVYGDEFYTPPRIVSALGPFDLDPCAGPMAYAARNLRREDDGLAAEWSGRVWLNPPYSTIEDWIERFIQHGNGVAFVNARPDTQWFQTLAEKADAVLWLRGRVHCLRPEGVKQTTATVGSVLVAYGERNAAALLASGLPGIVMTVRHCTPNNRISESKGSSMFRKSRRARILERKTDRCAAMRAARCGPYNELESRFKEVCEERDKLKAECERLTADNAKLRFDLAEANGQLEKQHEMLRRDYKREVENAKANNSSTGQEPA